MTKRSSREKFVQHFVSGEVVEGETLGEVSSETYEKHVPHVAEYIPYREAMELVRRSQQPDSDPSDPTAPFANDLHASIAENLGLEDYSQLEFYTAVSKTHLDVLHGIDAFFEYYPNQEDKAQIIVVTIDLTTWKKPSHKADVLIVVPAEGFDLKDPDDKKKCRVIVNASAGEIADLIRMKLAEIRN